MPHANRYHHLIPTLFLMFLLGGQAIAFTPPFEKVELSKSEIKRIEQKMKAQGIGNTKMNPALIERARLKIENEYKRQTGITGRLKKVDDSIFPKGDTGTSTPKEKKPVEKKPKDNKQTKALIAKSTQHLNPLAIIGGTTYNPTPSTGNVKALVLLVDFPDKPHTFSASYINSKFIGNQNPNSSDYPYESLKAYYSRASYGALNFQSNILGWYRYPHNRNTVPHTQQGRRDVIKAALNHYNIQGHNFAQYDSNNDGVIDYLAVIYGGESETINEDYFWWAYQTGFNDNGYQLDSKRIQPYFWMFEKRNPSKATFDTRVLLHESGHMLGLPDLYDYKITADIGPPGGVGGFGMMDGNKKDINPYFKWILGWANPIQISTGQSSYRTLDPTGTHPNSSFLVLFPQNKSPSMVSEFFIAQNRWPVANDDSSYPGNPYNPYIGMAYWHIDATLNNQGNWAFNNQDTAHKFIKVVPADGNEGLAWGDDDLFDEGQNFTYSTTPNSRTYNEEDSRISLTNLTRSQYSNIYQYSLWCSVTTPPNPNATNVIPPLSVLLLD